MDKKNIFNRMKKFPKVDLHRHLEGSITPETLVAVADKYGGKLPVYELKQLKPHIQVVNDPPDFQNFLSKFKVFRGFYPNRQAIEDIAYAAVKEAAEDNVKYLELRYSPTHFASNGKFAEQDVVEWISTAFNRACNDFDIIVIPLLTISRDYGVELAAGTVAMATRLPEGFFYGLDIAGDEVNNSAAPYAELFAHSKKSGLGLTIHAGEACGAANVRQAIKDFYADRIGHGVHAAEDESVMELVRARHIMLELCLTSNYYTGAVSSIKNHPIKKLMEYGVPVSLNSDDPAILGTTLTNEYVAAVTELGFSEDDLKAINRAALDCSFYPDKEKLKKELRHYWD